MTSTQNMMEDIEIQNRFEGRLYHYGSSNSNDTDVFVNLDFDPRGEEKIGMTLKKIEQTLKTVISQKSGINPTDIDFHFIYIENGDVVWSRNKDPEESQNCLYHTFFNHRSNIINYGENLPVNGPVQQSASLKAIRVVRETLTYISRTELRDEVKDLLKTGTFTQRVDFLTNLFDNQQFSQISNFNKKFEHIELYKKLAFYYAQLYALMNGEHVFTKFDACVRYPDIANYILRKGGEAGVNLENFMLETLNHFLNHMEYDEENDTIKFNGESSYYSNKNEEKVQ